MKEADFLPHLEIQVAEHCNLNCASCTHFSPLAKPSNIDKRDFYCQLQKANVIFCGHCKSLKIMGGEPLLHPEITELLYMARTAMPDTKITLQTNGVLLIRMTVDFWKSCSENNILVRVTRYPVSLDIAGINKKVVENNVDLHYHPSVTTIKSFKRYPLVIDGAGDANDNFSNCVMKQRYVLIKNYRLFPCPIVANIEHFNDMFNECLVRGDEDSVALDDIKSFEEYVIFARKAIQFCRYCNPAKHERDIGWKSSNRSIQEWI